MATQTVTTWRNVVANVLTPDGTKVTDPHPDMHLQAQSAINTLEQNLAALQAGGGVPQPLKYVAIGDDLNAALAGYEGLVILQRGTHTTSVPIVQNRRQMVVGEGGGATFIQASVSMPALWRIGNGAPCDRTHLSDVNLDCNGKAAIGLEINIVGTTGNLHGEPDGQVHVERVYVDDATDTGIYLYGSDTQAWHLYGCRVRRAGNYAYHLIGPDGWMTDCEGTQTSATGAGALVECANAHFKGNKMWYCKGYGWDIKGTRNTFVDCEAQDTGNHGWYIEFDKNTFIGCSADTASMYDVGGTVGGADGFYLATGLRLTTMSGCMSFDRQPAGHAMQQRYGFNMSASTYNIGRATVGTTAPTGTGTTPILIGALSGGGPSDANFGNLSGLLNLR